MQGSIRLRKCLRIASNATKSIFWGHAGLEKCPKLVSDGIFEQRANKINEKAGTEPHPPRFEKRVENMWFSQHFRKQQKRARCALDGTETQKTLENALFSMKFSGADAPQKLPKGIWTRTLVRNTPNMRFGSLRTRIRFVGKSQKNA